MLMSSDIPEAGLIIVLPFFVVVPYFHSSIRDSDSESPSEQEGSLISERQAEISEPGSRSVGVLVFLAHFTPFLRERGN